MLSALPCFITDGNSLPCPTEERKNVAGQIDLVRLFYITGVLSSFLQLFLHFTCFYESTYSPLQQ